MEKNILRMRNNAPAAAFRKAAAELKSKIYCF
jgi:hypothetical protein